MGMFPFLRCKVTSIETSGGRTIINMDEQPSVFFRSRDEIADAIGILVQDILVDACRGKVNLLEFPLTGEALQKWTVFKVVDVDAVLREVGSSFVQALLTTAFQENKSFDERFPGFGDALKKRL